MGMKDPLEGNGWGLLLSQTKRAIILEFQLMTAFHQRDGFDQVTKILRSFFS